MNIDKYINLLKADSRINEIHIKNVVSALYLNDSIKQDEKQLRKLINSDKNFNGCKVTKMLIEDLLVTIKDNKEGLFSLPDNVPVLSHDGISYNSSIKTSYIKNNTFLLCLLAIQLLFIVLILNHNFIA